MLKDSNEEYKDDLGLDNNTITETKPEISKAPPIFEPFEPLDIADLDLSKLPPRRWVYGKRLIRGYVSCFCGDGGVGKTSLSTAISLSVAIGRPLLRLDEDDEAHIVHKQGAVLYYNLEDPLDEMKLRMAAEIRHRGVNPRRLHSKLYLASGRDHPLCVASLQGGRIVRHDIKPAVDLLRRLGIVLLIVDPLMNAHTLDGNKNDFIAAVTDQFRKIAHDADVALLIVHHFRKGGQAGDVQSSLGAVMLTNGCRVVETVATMSEDDAKALGIDDGRRKSFVRIDNAKANLSPRATECEWYQFHSVALNNGTDEYPKGDNVGVLMRWRPTAPMDGKTWPQVSDVLDQIEKGYSTEGEFYTSAPQGKRWVGNLLMDMLRINKAQAKVLVKEWLDDGVLRKDTYISKERENKDAERLVVSPCHREVLRQRMTTAD